MYMEFVIFYVINYILLYIRIKFYINTIYDKFEIIFYESLYDQG
jgi:hypothetical protein